MVVAQGYEFEFNTLLRNPEVTSAEVAALLQRWEAAEPESVAVKVAYFNFLLQQGMREEADSWVLPPLDRGREAMDCPASCMAPWRLFWNETVEKPCMP